MKRGGSRLARRQARNHARYRGRNDINIVPMLDVMVILTFFLIFTAVFSKTSVVEINLPGPNVAAPPPEPTLELEVILRRNGLEVADRNVGVLETFPLTTTGFQDIPRLSDYLMSVKAKFPDKANATLLVNDDVDYDTIVQVMDAVRVRQDVDGTKVTTTSLFPQISLGDAPITPEEVAR
jgi:biopolymer transport protein ExbD